MRSIPEDFCKVADRQKRIGMNGALDGSEESSKNRKDFESRRCSNHLLQKEKAELRWLWYPEF